MGDTNWVKTFEPKADGDAELVAGMRYQLAFCYESGCGVPPDLSKAR